MSKIIVPGSTQDANGGWPYSCPAPSAPRPGDEWTHAVQDVIIKHELSSSDVSSPLTAQESQALKLALDAVQAALNVELSDDAVIDDDTLRQMRAAIIEREPAWEIPGSPSLVFEKFIKSLGTRAATLDELREVANDVGVRRAVEDEKFKLYVRERAQRELHGNTVEWVDVAAIIADGVKPPEPPSVLTFANDPGLGLLYEGRYNSIFGDGGHGKSLLMAAAQAWFINQGRHVVHLEYDNNSMQQVIWRVVSVGARPELVARFFHVLVTATEIPAHDFTANLVTLDSVNSAISMYDLDPNSSSRGVDTMIHRLVEPFTNDGATALSLDHVGNTNQDRPSNNRRKIQAVQGVMLRVEREGPAGRVGSRWMSRLTVVKDNPGWCPVAVGETMGYAVYDGTAGDGTCAVSLQKLPLGDLAAASAARERAEPRDIVLDIIQDATGTLSYTVRDVFQQLKERDVTVSESTVKRILHKLHGQDLIKGRQEGQGEKGKWHYFAAPAA